MHDVERLTELRGIVVAFDQMRLDAARLVVANWAKSGAKVSANNVRPFR